MNGATLYSIQLFVATVPLSSAAVLVGAGLLFQFSAVSVQPLPVV